MRKYAASTVIFLLGVLFAVGVGNFRQPRITRADEPSRSAAAQNALPKLQADIARLKDKAPDQAHAMMSVAYHFNNMWFAAEAENWPLAQFYWDETRSHLHWAVRIIPVREDRRGKPVKLVDILESLENGPLKELKQSIAEKDQEKFVDAYRFTLEGCYACHKASEKPYLRPQIPTQPAEPTINFDPAATWPR